MFTVTAGAQTTDDGTEFESVIEEVIVTATRRALNVREVPASVSVSLGSELEAIGASSMDQYAALIPGVNYIDSAAQIDSISMRGIATGTFDNLIQPTVAMYANEIPLTSYFFPLGYFDITPFDLERVEFLKGPQGTLYGSAAT